MNALYTLCSPQLHLKVHTHTHTLYLVIMTTLKIKVPAYKLLVDTPLVLSDPYGNGRRPDKAKLIWERTEEFQQAAG